MADIKNEFTNVTNLAPEAIGEPGQRTFRIRADSGSSTASLWLEKEQLFELAMTIHRLLAILPRRESPEGEPPFDREAPGLTSLDFKVGKLALGHDERSDLLFIDAHDAEDDEDGPATVRVWTNKSTAEQFADKALGVCAAGRPVCRLCGRPIDPTGHFCPRLNGHREGAKL